MAGTRAITIHRPPELVWPWLIDEAFGRISVVQVVDRGPQEPGQEGGPTTAGLVIRIRASFTPRLRAWAFWLAFDLGDYLFMRREMLGNQAPRGAETRGAQQPDLIIRDCRGRWSALTH